MSSVHVNFAARSAAVLSIICSVLFMGAAHAAAPAKAPAAPSKARVVDEKRAPLEGVKVYYYVVPRIQLESEAKQTTPVLTGADGSFELPPNELFGSIVVFEKEGFARQSHPSSSPLPREIVMGPGEKIWGHVTDESGTTLTDALLGPILSRAAGDSMEQQMTNPLLFVRTDDGGGFSVDGLRKGRYDFLARSPHNCLQLVQTATGKLTRVVLPSKGTSVTGVLRGSRDLLPKPGYWIRAGAEGGFGLFAKTGEDGRFVFGKLPAQAWSFSVVTPEASDRHPVRFAQLESGMEEFEVDVVLSQKMKIGGQFVNADTSAPIAGMELRLDVDPPMKVVTDSGGNFLFSGVDSQSDLVVRFDATRYVMRGPSGYLVEYLTVPQTTEDVTTITAALEERVSVSGKVVDNTGSPVAGAAIRARSTGAATMKVGKFTQQAEYTARSLAGGSFKLSVHPPGVYELTASTPQLTSLPQKIEAYTTSPARAMIELVGAAAVQGIVLDANDKPVTAATVRVYPADLQAQAESPDPSKRPKSLRAGRSGAKGEFGFSGLPPQRVFVQAFHPDFVQMASAVVALDAFASSTQNLKIPAGRDFSATVVSGSGQPVHDAEVRIVYTDNDVQKVLTRRSGYDGRVYLRAFGCGTLDRVSASATNYMDFEAKAVSLPQSGYSITMKERGVIVATVTEPADKEPSAQTSVWLLFSRGNTGRDEGLETPAAENYTNLDQRTVTEGKAEFRNLEYGWYKVAAVCGPLYVESAPVEITGPGEKTVDLVVQGSGGIRGRVTDKTTGKPVADVIVSVAPVAPVAANAEPQSGVTGADGAYTIASTPVGALQLTASHPYYPEFEKNVQASAQSATQVDIVLSSVMGKLSGTVTYGGAGVANALLIVYRGTSQDKPVANALSDAGGRYEMAKVPPGTYTMAVEAPVESEGVSHRTYSVTVDADGSTFDIRFAKPVTVRGRVTVRGAAAKAGQSIMFMPKTAGLGSANPAVKAGGTYEAQLEPGVYSAGLEDQPGKEVTIPAVTEPHQLDLSF